VRGGESERLVQHLATEFPDIEVVPDDASRLTDVTIVAGRVADDEVERMPALSWVHSWAAGVENDVGPALRERGIPVTSSAGNGAVPLAEHAIMLALLLNRNATRWLDAQREQRWDRFTHAELHGKTLGIYGFG